MGPSPGGWFEGVLFRKKPVDSGTVFMPWHLMVWASVHKDDFELKTRTKSPELLPPFVNRSLMNNL